jgi:hypothetical protein
MSFSLPVKVAFAAIAGIIALVAHTAAVHASCGDYLVVGGEIAANTNGEHHPGLMGGPKSSHSSAPDPKPCNGPHCSRGRALPPPAPTHSTPDQDPSAILTADGEEHGATRAMDLDCRFRGYASWIGDGLMRPPNNLL